MADAKQIAAQLASDVAGLADKVEELNQALDQDPAPEPGPAPDPTPDPTPDPDQFPIVDDKGKLQRAKRPPEAVRELRATPTTLLNVVRQKAQPGDHIVLDDGDYGAGYGLDRAFPPDKKLVIRSKTPMGANFTVPLRFLAPGYWLHECRTSYDRGVDKDSFNIKVEADHVNITRCWIQGRDGIASRAGAVGHVQIGWCRFSGRNRGANSCDHIYFWLPLAGNYVKPTDGPNNISIHYNFFDDPASKAAEDHSIYFGTSKAGKDDLPMMANVFIDYNYWAPTCNRTRPLYMKRGCYIRRNTCLSKQRNFGIRHGMESKVWANIIEPWFFHFSGAVGLGGTSENYHDIRGNEAPNSSLILFCGSKNGDITYQAASYALALSNRLKSIEVGVRNGTVSTAQGGLIHGCKILLDGKVPSSAVNMLNCKRETIAVDDGNGGMWIPATDRLDETRVGLQTTGQGAER